MEVRTLGLVLLAVVAVGCSGDEAPTQGDNPAARDAVSSANVPGGSRRGSPSAGRSNSKPTSTPADFKGR
jgi:hypothetical protein